MSKKNLEQFDLWASYYSLTSARERVAIMVVTLPFVWGFLVGLTDWEWITAAGVMMIFGLIYLGWRLVLRLGLFAAEKVNERRDDRNVDL